MISPLDRLKSISWPGVNDVQRRRHFRNRNSKRSNIFKLIRPWACHTSRTKAFAGVSIIEYMRKSCVNNGETRIQGAMSASRVRLLVRDFACSPPVLTITLCVSRTRGNQPKTRNDEKWREATRLPPPYWILVGGMNKRWQYTIISHVGRKSKQQDWLSDHFPFTY